MKSNKLKFKTMKKTILIIYIALATLYAFSQQSDYDYKSVDIAIRNNGLSIGNSKGINGLRINFRDKHLQKVNGINFTIWKPKDNTNKNSIINGFALGIVLPYATKINGFGLGLGLGGGQLNGISLGILGTGAERGINGLGIGGLGIGSEGNINGIILGGLGSGCEGNANGILFGGLGTGCEGDVNGILFGGLGSGCEGNLNGISFGLLGTGCEGNLNGLLLGGLGAGCEGILKGFGFAGIGIGSETEIQGVIFSGGMIKTKIFKGLGICSYSKIDNYYGISFAIFNNIKNLHGIEFGLVNYAGNNKRFLKVLPLINLHLN